MSTEQELRRIAHEAAGYAQDRLAVLEQEVMELQQRLAEKEAERDAARDAPTRLANFSAGSGGNYFCPHCWIERGVRSALRPIGGGTNDHDLFRCRDVDHTIEVPF